METENIHVPETLTFTASDRSRATGNRRYRDGWYFAVIRGARNAVSQKTGDFQQLLTLYPLMDPNDVDSEANERLFARITMPTVNPDWEDHTVNQYADAQVRRIIPAIFDDVPAMPAKVDNQWVFRGEPIGGDQYDDAKAQVTDAIFSKLGSLWEDPSQYEGHAVYIKVVTKGKYTNVNQFRAELPDGEDLIIGDDMFEIK